MRQLIIWIALCLAIMADNTTVAADVDADADGVIDSADNCTLVSNASQLDSDGDGYGNLCDGDLNNSALTTSADFNLMRTVFNHSAGSSALAAASDMNGSGLVTAADFTLLRARMNTVPGPSGINSVDTTPDPWTFTDQGNVALSTLITSGAITVTGINTATSISIGAGSAAGSAYSVGCTGTFTTSAGTITNNQTVCVRHTSSGAFSTAVSTALTIGGISDTFTSTTTAADTTPNAFSFADQTNVSTSTVITSAAVTITGINTAAPISVSGGTFSVGCGATFSSASGTISNNQTVCVRHTSSANFSTATNTVLTIGGIADTFTSTTAAADAIPNAFAFADQTGVALSSLITSAAVTITGINTAASITIGAGSAAGSAYSVGCTGTFTTSAGTVTNNQTVCVQHTSSANFSTAVNTVLTIGGVSDTFTSTTTGADTTPNAFAFTDQANVALSTPVTSNAIAIAGINAATAISIGPGSAAGSAYSVGCTGTFTTVAGTVTNGQTVCVRHTSAGSYATATNTVLTVGSVSDTFTSTTIAAPTSVNLSGSASIPAGNFVDGDTNDPSASYTFNDLRTSAQPLLNPATVGGYVNDIYTGSIGPSYWLGDYDDYYVIDAVAGQIVTLAIADYLSADLDLYLENSSGTVVDASLGTSIYESVVIPVSGRYYIDVYEYSGASNYTLTVGQNLVGSSAGDSELRLSSDFVPDEVIVQEKPAAKLATPGTTAERRGLVQRAGGVRGRPGLYAAPANRASASRRNARGPGERSFRSAGDRTKWQTLLAVKELRADPDVQYAEPNYIVQPLVVPNDPLYPNQWHYPLIRLPAAWEVTIGISSVIVAVIDTGVVSTHPDLQGKLVGGYDFISNVTHSLDGDGIDPDPYDPGDDLVNGNSSFHGTHVTGTIVAATNNGIGVAGIAPGARVMPLRVLGANGGSAYDVAQAMLFAARLPNDSNQLPPQRAAIINMSLGSQQACLATYQSIVDQVRAQGVIVIAAAGNSSTSAPGSPASCNGVVSVSAVGSDKSFASAYSNFGSTIDVAAPGGNPNGRDLNGDGSPDYVLSTAANDGFIPYPTYEWETGTSMAAPHVAGVVALMKSVNANLTPAQFDQLLAAGSLTEDRGTPGRDDYYGYGLIDARKAVEAAGGSAQTTPWLTGDLVSMNFGAVQTVVPFNVYNSGGGALQVTTYYTNQSWLQVSPGSVNASGLGTYNVTVNRSGRSPGVYSGAVTIVSSVNTLTIPILMSVTAGSSAGSVGILYVLLLDGGTGEVVDSREVSSTTGSYGFNFSGVAPGNYLIAAGTDLNNDGYICDPSEACGGYPTLDQFGTVLVGQQDQSGLNFSVGFAPDSVASQSLGSGTVGAIDGWGIKRPKTIEHGIRKRERH